MSDLILVNLNNGQQIKLNAANLKRKMTLENEIYEEDSASIIQLDDGSIFDENDDSMFSDADSSLNSDANGSGDAMKPKKKRQRLTHLTQEEKLQRRKLKNRAAAQSARDRKKARMDELEETVVKLQQQNAKLKSENKLLKEKTQLLLDENRKLLVKTKESGLPALKSSQCMVSSRSLVSAKSTFEAVESAAFNSHVSQQKKQLQMPFQQLVYMLIICTMQLLKQEQSKLRGLQQSTQKVKFAHDQLAKQTGLKIVKLKATLILSLIHISQGIVR